MFELWQIGAIIGLFVLVIVRLTAIELELKKQQRLQETNARIINKNIKTIAKAIDGITADESRLVAVPVQFLFDAMHERIRHQYGITDNTVTSVPKKSPDRRLTISELLALDDAEGLGLSGAPDVDYERSSATHLQFKKSAGEKY